MKLNIAAFLFAFTIFCIGAKAQQTHFIYLQTNDKQPFYVKFDKAVYSSSVSGYLILPKLVDNTYNFSIGFPKSEWPQQNFSCTIEGKDKGYLLKNFGDKGWGLFDLQTLDVIMAVNKPVENKNVIKEERTDSFSNMLSAVVNDPGIKMEVKQPEVKVDTTVAVEPAPIVQKETPVVVKEAAAIKTPPAPKEDVVVVKPKKNSTIIKLLDNTDNDGTQLVYVDMVEGHKDTIRIFVPADKLTEKKELSGIQEPSAPKSEPVKAQPKKEDKKFIDVDMPAAKNTTDAGIVTKPETKAVAPDLNKQTISIKNGNCKTVAVEEDFLKLRKKMAAEENDDDMVSVATKVFKIKCFNTSQIKGLGFLFLNDKGRYSFFDKAYSFVSDPANYGLLESQLSEPYYIARFKALINH